MKKHYILICGILTLAACEDPEALEVRELPIAAVGQNGTPLFVGTYEAESRALRLEPALRGTLARSLDARGLAPGGVSLETPFERVGLPLNEDEVILNDTLAVGDELALVADQNLGALWVMPVDWSDGLDQAVWNECIMILEWCIWPGGTGPTFPEPLNWP